jgi:hypothetical protein
VAGSAIAHLLDEEVIDNRVLSIILKYMKTSRPDRAADKKGRVALRGWERRYVKLRLRLAAAGYIAVGSINRLRIKCGNPRCLCRRAKKYRHGPYVFWTSKRKGKTVTRSLSSKEAALYIKWIKNRRNLEEVLQRMFKVSREVAKQLLDGEDAFIPKL